jgi:cytochrome c oxidase assembly protein subunit 15
VVVALAVATALGAYALVVLGSTVRATQSGMGCSSWPLCDGHIGPVDRFHALLEQSHRYLAAPVTVRALSTVVAARRARIRHAALAPALAAAGLVLFQAALGALTVLAKNAPWTVAVHLVTGLVFFGVTAVTAVVAIRGRRASWSRAAVGSWGWALLAATLATLVGGSLVVANGAGDACPAWPLCPSSASSLADWQMLHRVLAGVSGFCLAGFVVSWWRTASGWRRASAVVPVGLFAGTAAVGTASALSRAAATWQDTHLAMVALLWASVVAMVTVRATEPSPAVQESTPPLPTPGGA